MTFRNRITAFLAATTMLVSPLAAQNASSGSPRVQGVPAGYGDPVQVTIRNTDGSAPVAIPVSLASEPLPSGASTSALQTTGNTTLSTIATNTTSIATAANQTTQITDLGGVTETAPATDTASSGLNGRQQRIAQRLTTINTTLGSPFQAGGSIGNSSFASTQSGTWNITNVSGTVSLPTGAATAAKQPALGTAGTASADVISIQGVASMTPIVNTPYAVAGSTWSYAAATSGILNTTTAVTIKAAAGVSTRNYITSIQYDFQSFTTATEIAIRDGAGGTVLWRGYIPAGVAGIREVNFYASPLRGTANTLLEFVTLTASGAGAVYINAQGFTGS